MDVYIFTKIYHAEARQAGNALRKSSLSPFPLLTQDEIAFIESMVRPMPASAEDADKEASDE